MTTHYDQDFDKRKLVTLYQAQEEEQWHGRLLQADGIYVECGREQTLY